VNINGIQPMEVLNMTTQSTEIPFQAKGSLDLPQPIAAYFAADKGDIEAFSQCFTDNAVVQDEGETHGGRSAIRQWKANTSTKYQYTSEPFVCEPIDGDIVVTSRLTGNFPGSPVNLRFHFRLDGDKIASLKIVP